MKISIVLINLFICIGLAVVFLHIKEGLTLFVRFYYCLSSVIVITSIFHYPYPSPSNVLGLTLFFFIILTYKLRGLALISMPRHTLLPALLVYLSFLVFQILEGFMGNQATRTEALPMSRLLFERTDLPTQLYYEDLPYHTAFLSYSPVLTKLGALSFSLFRQATEEATGLIPAAFFLGFLGVLWKWCEEKRVTITLTAILLIASPFFLEKFSWFHYDSPLIFSATWLFFMLWKYSREKADRFLYYAMIGSCLGLLSKHTSIVFTGLLVAYIFENKRLDKKTWGLFVIFHLPAIFWYSRNIYYLGDPIMPYLKFLSEPTLRSWLDAHRLLEHEGWNKLLNLALVPVLLPLMLFWIVAFPLSDKLRSDVFFRRSYVLFCLFSPVWFLYNLDIRHIMPFYGMALVQIGSLLQTSMQAPHQSERGESIYRYIRYLLQPVAPLCLVIIMVPAQAFYVKRIFPDHVSPHLRAAEFLQNEEKAGPKTKIFADTDHILAWRGDYIVFYITVPKFAPDFLKAQEEGDFYNLFRRYGIKYAINHPWKSRFEDKVFDAIRKDTRHFKEIYRDDVGTEIWKVLTEDTAIN